METLRHLFTQNPARSPKGGTEGGVMGTALLKVAAGIGDGEEGP